MEPCANSKHSYQLHSSHLDESMSGRLCGTCVQQTGTDQTRSHMQNQIFKENPLYIWKTSSEKLRNSYKWGHINLKETVAEKHNQEACLYLPGCTCPSHRPIWPVWREEESQLWALQKSQPSLFVHTITPMSLMLNSCDLLPSLSQHSSPAVLHCQDSKQANSNWLIYFLNHTLTNKQLWSQRSHTDLGLCSWIPIVDVTAKAFFHFSIFLMFSAYVKNAMWSGGEKKV